MAFTDTYPAEDLAAVVRRPFRRAVVVFVVVALGELLLIAGGAAWLVNRARGDFEEARALAAEGQAAARALDLEAAEAAFAGAAERFDAGNGRLRNPLVRVVGLLPVLRENIAAAGALGEAGYEVAAAARDLVGLINDQPDGLQSFLPDDGAFPVERLGQLADEAERARQRLARAADFTAAAPRERLVGAVANAQREFDGQLEQAQSLVGTTASVSRALSTFMGGEGKRRYLFGAQSPSELRGTGGYIGAYAVATFTDGRFKLGRFRSIHDLDNLPISKVPPPNADYAARYNRFGGAGFWPGINATPDFPSAARAILALYERAEGETFDGVVVVDPFALEALLRLVGEVEVPRMGEVDERNVVQVVANEAYSVFGGDHRKELLGAVAASALDRLLQGGANADPLTLLQELGPVAQRRHILMYSTDPQVQQTLDEVNLTGALPAPDNDTLSVVVNNTAVNKVDYYVDRRIRYRVRLAEDGSARGRLRVTFINRAPASGAGQYVLGPHLDGYEPGDNRGLVSIFCGRCEPVKGKPKLVDGERFERGFVLEEELGHTVATTHMELPRGAKRRLELTWDLEDAWDPAGDGCYALDFVGQTTIREPEVDVRVEPPPGYSVLATDDDAPTDGVVHSGQLRGSFSEEVCFRKEPGAE